jgi:heat shock protein HspQ
MQENKKKKNFKFQVGDLVSHAERGFVGVIVKALDDQEHQYNYSMYKVVWEHGDWMYEIEDQLKIEVRARNV